MNNGLKAKINTSIGVIVLMFVLGFVFLAAQGWMIYDVLNTDDPVWGTTEGTVVYAYTTTVDGHKHHRADIEYFVDGKRYSYTTDTRYKYTKGKQIEISYKKEDPEITRKVQGKTFTPAPAFIAFFCFGFAILQIVIRAKFKNKKQEVQDLAELNK